MLVYFEFVYLFKSDSPECAAANPARPQEMRSTKTVIVERSSTAEVPLAERLSTHVAVIFGTSSRCGKATSPKSVPATIV